MCQKPQPNVEQFGKIVFLFCIVCIEEAKYGWMKTDHNASLAW